MAKFSLSRLGLNAQFKIRHASSNTTEELAEIRQAKERIAQTIVVYALLRLVFGPDYPESD